MELNTIITNLNNLENSTDNDIINFKQEKDFVVKKNYDHIKKIELVKKLK